MGRGELFASCDAFRRTAHTRLVATSRRYPVLSSAQTAAMRFDADATLRIGHPNVIRAIDARGEELPRFALPGLPLAIGDGAAAVRDAPVHPPGRFTTVLLVNLRDGAVVRLEMGAVIHHVGFFAGGTRLAVIAEGLLSTFDCAGHRLASHTVPADLRGWAFAVSGDAKRIAMQKTDALELVDLESGRVTIRSRRPYAFPAAAGDALFLAAEEGDAELVDWEGNVLRRFAGVRGACAAAAPSRAVLASQDRVCVLDLASGEARELAMPGRGYPDPGRIAISDDGRHAAVAFQGNHEIVRIDCERAVAHADPRDRASIRGLATDGDAVLVAIGSSAEVLDAATLETRRMIALPARSGLVALAGNRAAIFDGSAIHFWTPERDPRRVESLWIRALEGDAEGETFLAAGPHVHQLRVDGGEPRLLLEPVSRTYSQEVEDMSESKSRSSRQYPFYFEDTSAEEVFLEVAPRAGIVLSAVQCEEAAFELLRCSVETGTRTTLGRIPGSKLNQTWMAADGSWALVVVDEKVVEAWDVAAGRRLFAMPIPGGVVFIAGSPNRRHWLSTSPAGEIRLWMLNETIDQFDLTSAEDAPESVCFGCDGGAFFVGTRRGVVLRFALDAEE